MVIGVRSEEARASSAGASTERAKAKGSKTRTRTQSQEKKGQGKNNTIFDLTKPAKSVSSIRMLWIKTLVDTGAGKTAWSPRVPHCHWTFCKVGETIVR